MIVIQAADVVDADVVAAVATLIPQLSSTSAPPTLAELQAIVSNPATTLLLAKEDNQVVGMLTLATFPVPTGIRAWIEDVVVDDDARGAGVAERAGQGRAGRGRTAGIPHGRSHLAPATRGRQPLIRAARL